MEQATTGAPTAPTPAGWHPDPWQQAPLRWWDGTEWTGYTNEGFPAPAANDDALKFVLPVGRSGWAIAAGYLGLFSVLLVFAPFALLAGILGLRAIKRRPELWGRGRAWFGIVMGAPFSVLLVVLVVASQTR